jgi:hypothetical protein
MLPQHRPNLEWIDEQALPKLPPVRGAKVVTK